MEVTKWKRESELVAAYNTLLLYILICGKLSQSILFNITGSYTLSLCYMPQLYSFRPAPFGGCPAPEPVRPPASPGRTARLPANPDTAPPIAAGRGGHHHGGRGPAHHHRPVRPRAAGPAIAPCAHRRAGIRSGGRHQQPDTQKGQFQFHASPEFSGPTARLKAPTIPPKNAASIPRLLKLAVNVFLRYCGNWCI